MSYIKPSRLYWVKDWWCFTYTEAQELAQKLSHHFRTEINIVHGPLIINSTILAGEATVARWSKGKQIFPS